MNATARDERLATTGDRRVRFVSIAALARRLADEVGDALGEAIARRAAASLVVSGGGTPAHYLPAIAQCDLDWSRVTVTLADERCVDAHDAHSNAGFVRRHLLQGAAQAANFVALRPGPGAARALAGIAHPYDVVLLGMGEDGHVASLFPDSPMLRDGLDLASTARCIAVPAPAGARPSVARTSMTLAELLDSRRIVVAMQGEAKRAVFERALGGGDAALLPIRALLDAAPAGHLDVYWAP